MGTMDCLASYMKRVFVLTIKAIDQARNVARGYAEDVETGTEFSFQSFSELLGWLGRIADPSAPANPECPPAEENA